MTRRLFTIGPDNEPLWVWLSIHPVDNVWAARIVADGVEPLMPGELKGTGFFGDRPAEAQGPAQRDLGGNTEQN